MAPKKADTDLAKTIENHYILIGSNIGVTPDC